MTGKAEIGVRHDGAGHNVWGWPTFGISGFGHRWGARSVTTHSRDGHSFDLGDFFLSNAFPFTKIDIEVHLGLN